jgi:hypothetical protein
VLLGNEEKLAAGVGVCYIACHLITLRIREASSRL